MELIYPSFEIKNIMGDDPLDLIEYAGRTCYKSDKKDTEVFVQRLIRMGHHSVLEHSAMTVKFIIDRGISHELVRHRLCAFSQECLSGDTEVKKGKTIKYLSERKDSSYGKTRNKTINLRSCNDKNEIIPNKMIDVFKKGKGEVYKIKTELGYTIKATENHKFMRSDGSFDILKNLKVGDEVMVNGRTCLLKIDDSELEDLYLNEGLNPTEISNKFGVSYRSVLKRLKKLKIFEKRKNDKNKEKYNKNHTKESIIKMSNSLIKGFKNGRVTWNRGVFEKENISVFKQAESLRKNHHNNGAKENNSNWKGGISVPFYINLMKDIKHCQLCGSNEKELQVHHIDKNRKNNKKDNLIKLCTNCHKKIHLGWYIGKKAHPDKIIEISYSGIEDVYDIEMKDPFHNYIANGFIVHNSTRYISYKNHITFIIPPWVNLKEGIYTTVNCDRHKDKWWCFSMLESSNIYKLLVDSGWSPQQARSVLPNSLKTEIVVTANFREWRHILKLRTGKDSHPQIREVMIPLLLELRKTVPIVFDEVGDTDWSYRKWWE